MNKNLFQRYKETYTRSSGQEVEPAPGEQTPTYLVEKGYVEKVASALEYLGEVGYLPSTVPPTLEKVANIGRVRTLMAEGIPLERAVRMAYPNASEEEVAQIISKMKGSAAQGQGASPARATGAPQEDISEQAAEAPKEGVEKRAAKNRLLQRLGARSNSNSLKQLLKEKLADQIDEEDAASDAQLESVFSRIQGLHDQYVVSNDEPAPVAAPEIPLTEDTDSTSPVESSPEAETPGDVVEAALESVFRTDTEPQSSESDPSETESVTGDAETASEQGSGRSNMAALLRARLEQRDQP